MSDPLHIDAGIGTTVGTATIDTAGEFTITAHGLVDGQPVRLDSLTGGATTAFAEGTTYYVVDAATDTFSLVSIPGDTVITLGSAGGADVHTAAPHYTALELRRLESGLLFNDSGDRFGAREGVHPACDPAVSVSGTTWTVHDILGAVYPGITDTSGSYRFAHPEESGSFDPADGAQDRIDALYLQIQDNNEDSSGFRRARAVYAAGDPGSGSPPDQETEAPNSLELGTFDVLAGGGGISVRSLALFTVAAGGVLPVRDSTELPTAGLYDGMAVFQQDTEALLIDDGTGIWEAVGNRQGYQFGQQVRYTSNDAFDPADYPGARAARVRCQASAGAGGGAVATLTGQGSCGSGGEGGAYAESFILWAAIEAEAGGGTITVTVPAGGTGVSGGDGNNGAACSFGSLLSADGGVGGSASANSGNAATVSGAVSSQPGTGDILIPGGGGGFAIRAAGGHSSTAGGQGGDSVLGNGGRGGGFNTDGAAGRGFGGGGSGAANNQDQSDRAGGTGAPAICIVDIFY